MSSGFFVGQEHIASLLANYLGMTPIPSASVESACASGGLALRQGFIDVASGMNDIVLVGGVEKMTDVGGREAIFVLGTAADQQYDCYHGVTFPRLYALTATALMHKYGTTREQIAMVAVKNHRNGSKNPDEGEIVSYTIIRVPPEQFTDQAPYAVGIIELDDEVKILAQIVDCNFDELAVGKKVKIEFRKIREEGEAGIICYGYKGRLTE